MEHFFSESSVWKTTSEFVSRDGRISPARGESVISVHETGITNESWTDLDGIRRMNTYKIVPVSSAEYSYESLNPDLGKQTGVFHLDRNCLFPKFKIEGAALNGYEMIRREGDICYARGALYERDALINTWSATMYKESDK